MVKGALVFQTDFGMQDGAVSAMYSDRKLLAGGHGVRICGGPRGGFHQKKHCCQDKDRTVCSDSGQRHTDLCKAQSRD